MSTSVKQRITVQELREHAERYPHITQEAESFKTTGCALPGCEEGSGAGLRQSAAGEVRVAIFRRRAAGWLNQVLPNPFRRERSMAPRPTFIRSAKELPEYVHVYPQSAEKMGPVRRLGKEAGLERIGINVQRLPPGARSSWPHAEENEEEFVYVLEGEVDAWIDGTIYRMVAGDLAAFRVGTGICHCFINNGQRDVHLLVGGEAQKQGSRIFYPLNPSRREDIGPSNWWDDAPRQELGPHDALPDTARQGS